MSDAYMNAPEPAPEPVPEPEAPKVRLGVAWVWTASGDELEHTAAQGIAIGAQQGELAVFGASGLPIALYARGQWAKAEYEPEPEPEGAR